MFRGRRMGNPFTMTILAVSKREYARFGYVVSIVLGSNLLNSSKQQIGKNDR